MRSKQLQLASYRTDKVGHGLLSCYDPVFGNLVDREIKLLEIGVKDGGSVLLWRDYFPKATVVGIDVVLPDGLAEEERIQLFQGSQDDTSFLSDVARQTAPDGFDIIIDDASHLGSLTKITFWHLFEHHLKPSGIYAIEDWGTGYFDNWHDGRTYQAEIPTQSESPPAEAKPDPKAVWPTHSHGMVGFVKQLIDEQGAPNLTMGRLFSDPGRPSKFEKTIVTPPVVFVTKRAA